MTNQPEATTFDFDFAPFIYYRDREACARARAIPEARIAEHANPDFQISVIQEKENFYSAFAKDIVGAIEAARDAGTSLVAILPVGPMPQYALAARMINERALSLAHVHTFNMDEYANDAGTTAPATWPGSFQRAMWDGFLGLIEPQLRPPESQIHFPSSETLADYGARLEDLGGADVCYGGIGWAGHVAFWEPHVGDEFEGDMDAYLAASCRVVDLHPMTIMQNALHSFSGDWSAVPPRAATIGPKEIMGARRRSFWLDGYLGGGVSWQRFIARLVAHGPVTTHVPGSILQTARTDYTLLRGVAADVEVSLA